MNKSLISLLFLFFLGFSSCSLADKNSHADWTVVAEKSAITFVSTKQSHIREVHQIQTFDVSVTEQKQITVKLDLNSIESGIPIRNERMREMLFDVANFRYATLSFSLPEPLNSTSGTKRYQLDGKLSLKNKSATIQLDVLLTTSDKQVTASLLKPVIITAQLFDLQEGVDALQKIAGLTSIGYSVPVQATITLKK